MIVKIKKLHPDAVIPKQSTELAGGWDVVVTEIDKRGLTFVMCNLGFALQPPKGYKVTMVPRSSFTKYNWILQNSPCLGDEDYMGQYQLNFRAIPTGIMQTPEGQFRRPDGTGGVIKSQTILTYDEFPYNVGDRIGQMYIEKVEPTEFELVVELEETKRGEGRFGHTGK